jgi:hypothetical protein
MRKLLLGALCLTLASCATFSPKRYERSAAGVVALVNLGKAADLAAMSRTPFVLDGELLLLPSDVSDFWQGALKAGLRIDPAAAVAAVPLDADSYKRFASSMEVRTFFQKYVSNAKGSLVALEDGKSRILLLLERDKKGRMLIVGFKGPDAL